MAEDDRKLVGRRLRQIRENQGYSQSDLARKLGLPETEIYKIEEGSFSLDLLHILSHLFRVLESSMLRSWTEHKGAFLSKNEAAGAANGREEK